MHENLIPQNIQTYPTIQNIIDNTLKQKPTLQLASVYQHNTGIISLYSLIGLCY